MTVWHLADGVWSQYTPSLLTVDSSGVASFTVTSFSGYALAVPEPSMVGVLILSGVGGLRRPTSKNAGRKRAGSTSFAYNRTGE